MNANGEVNTIKKASIIPNFECSSVNGIDYKISIDIKIKVDKPYVVKNIRDFIYLINNNAINIGTIFFIINTFFLLCF